MRSSNVTWHPGQVDRADRAERFGARGATLWLTGLSGSGKSTLAVAVEQRLVAEGVTPIASTATTSGPGSTVTSASVGRTATRT